MNLKEIREKETEHLSHELSEKRKHLFALRSQAVTEKLEDPSQIGKTRKEIARMMTILRQREIETQKKSEPTDAQTTSATTTTATVTKKSSAKKKTTAKK